MIVLPPALTLVFLLAWGTVVGFDLASVPQGLLSRPLVAASMAGWLIGDLQSGIRVGALLELFALDVLPVGASRYPEYGPAAIGAALLASRLPPIDGLGFAVLLGLGGALFAGWTLDWLRHANARHVHRVSEALNAGSPAVIRRLQWAGLGRDALRSLGVTSLAVTLRAAHRRLVEAVRADFAVAHAGDGGRGRRGGAHRRAQDGGSGAAACLAGRGCRRRPRGRDGGGGMRGRGRALLRLLAVQGAWNYERMTGIGMGYAAEPMLEDLRAASPARHREATARSAEFFNCHPYLAGLALGASVRAEHEGVPGAQIQRLRTALCSPLGALGDQVFWAGLVPIVICLALVTIALGGGARRWPPPCWPTMSSAMLVTRWALTTGLGTGMQVGTAISASWLPKVAARIARAGRLRRRGWPCRWWPPGCSYRPRYTWCSRPTGSALAALALFRWGGARWTSPRVALLFAVVTFLWTRVVP